MSQQTIEELLPAEDRMMEVRLSATREIEQTARNAPGGTLTDTGKIAGRSGNGRTSRAKAVLGGGRSITVEGPGLDLEAFIKWLDELSGKAKRALPARVRLTTFMRMLKDSAS